MTNGYFFIDPRTCEEILYIPRVVEVRCFESKKRPGYVVNLDINRLEQYAVAGSKSAGGLMWSVKNGFAQEIPIEDGILKELCRLCRQRDRESKKQAFDLAIDLFDAISYGLIESNEDDDFLDIPEEWA